MITMRDPSNLSYRPSAHSFQNKIGRVIWNVVWLILFRPSPKIFHSWRIFLLRIFGAKVGKNSYVYPSARIWAPWHLRMGNYSCLSRDVDCYCVDNVIIGNHVTVSQYSYLCTATHDYTKWDMPLKTGEIRIADHAWVCAGAFVGLGVSIGEGAVIAARAVVVRDVEPWSVMGGNPARKLKSRVMDDEGSSEGSDE
jgi:putative colanic acid biosynthesis acetyltransferase WcaF